ncbi:MAG: hypothetical protein ACK4UO_16890 [Pseudolabrys sp.]
MTMLVFPACAQNLFHRAENRVQVALVKVDRSADYTEVHLQAQAALKGVCWNLTGEDSPYLLAEGRRHYLLKGDNITACPKRRAYANKEIMVLRFQPLSPEVRTFSLVEGRGGEKQMTDPASTKGIFWNFLNVKLG